MVDNPAIAPVDPAAAPAVVPTDPAAVPQDWKTGLSDDLLANKSIHEATSLESFAKQFVDLQAYQGTSIRIPSENAGTADLEAFHSALLAKVPGLMPKPDITTPETMGAVFDAMGRPAKPEDYTRPQVEDAPPIDEERDKSFTAMAHEIGITKQQFEKIYEWELGQNKAGGAAHQERVAANINAAKQEWGYAYDDKMAGINQTFGQLDAPKSLLEALQGGEVAPEFLQFFARTVEALTGQAEFKGQPNDQNGRMTPTEAELQIQEIQARPEYRHHDPLVRQPWIDKMQELIKLAKPDALTGDAALNDLRGGGGGGGFGRVP